MRNLQKGFIVPLLLIIVAVIFAGGGAYVYTQQKQGNAPATESSTTQATSEWKTYRNSQVGFEFKYPQNWTWRAYGTDGTIGFYDTNIFPIMTLSVSNDAPSVEQKRQDSKKDTGVTATSLTQVNGMSVLKIEYRDSAGIHQSAPSDNFYFVANGKGIYIGFSIFPDGPTEYMENQILSTFNSTTQTTSTTQTSDQKTYSSAKYGFSFSYPATWAVTETNDGLTLTPSNSEANTITIMAFSAPEKAPSISCPMSTHKIECSFTGNDHGVPYVREISAGQSTAQTYQEKILTGYVAHLKESLTIRTLITDASGKTFSATAPVVDGILQSLVFADQKVTQEDIGKILVGDKTRYENLSAEGKAILDGYRTFLTRKNAYALDDSLVSLKYYDLEKMLVSIGDGKGAGYLHLVDRDSSQDVGNNNGSLVLFGGYIESTSYAISVGVVGNNGIFYYKAGDSTIRSVPNSKPSSGETYEKSPGMGGGDYTLSFDEPTRTLTAVVYHGDQYGNGTGQKIRTVRFVLP